MDLGEVHWQTRRRLSVKNTGIVKFPSHGADKCPEPQRGAATHKRKLVVSFRSLGKWVWFVYLSKKCQTGKVSPGSVHNESVRPCWRAKTFCFLIIYKQTGQTVGFTALECSDGEIKIKINLCGTFSFVPGENSYLINEKKKSRRLRPISIVK